MPANKKRMGFEGQLFYGNVGSTAATYIKEARDISIAFEIEEGETTERPAVDSADPPIETSDVTKRKISIEFTVTNKDGGVADALIAKAALGQPVALRGKDKIAGKGPDGDFILSYRDGKPIAGEQTVQFTAKPTLAGGRDPQIYV
jgi:hypothetical protein